MKRLGTAMLVAVCCLSLTTDVFASFEVFDVAEGLAPGTVRDRFRHDPEAGALLAELEIGLPRPRERTDPRVVELRERALRALGVA